MDAVNREARRLSKRAIQRLAYLMDDEESPPTVQLAAANAILDRAIGKPKTMTEMTVNGTISVEHQHLDALKEIADARRELRERAIEAKGDWVQKPEAPNGRPSLSNAKTAKVVDVEAAE